MAQVQVRIPEKLLKELDKWIAQGKYTSRSDAIKTIVALQQERERMRKFFEILLERSKEARTKPETLVPLDQIA